MFKDAQVGDLVVAPQIFKGIKKDCSGKLR